MIANVKEINNNNSNNNNNNNNNSSNNNNNTDCNTKNYQPVILIYIYL